MPQEKLLTNFYTTQEPISYLLLQRTGTVASMNNEERLNQMNNLFCGLHFLVELAIHTFWHTTRLVSLLRQKKDSIEKRQLLLTVKKVSSLSSKRRESSSSQNSIPNTSHIHTHSYTGQLPYPYCKCLRVARV